jgi:hypothetical protein
VKQPGHLTSMKNERGSGTRFCRNMSIIHSGDIAWDFGGNYAYLELVLASHGRWGWVEEIYGENLSRQNHVSLLFNIHRIPACTYCIHLHQLNEAHICYRRRALMIPSSLTPLCPVSCPILPPLRTRHHDPQGRE